MHGIILPKPRPGQQNILAVQVIGNRAVRDLSPVFDKSPADGFFPFFLIVQKHSIILKK
jgi:hypothetical protein